jgi:undecaprenyl-diphosphatase
MTRQVSMPSSTSFPSGHAASGAAFATGVAGAFPEAGIPLGAAAALVAYSRVHTGVHYPVDVIVGSVTGTTVAQLVVAVLDRGRNRPTVAPLHAGRWR